MARSGLGIGPRTRSVLMGGALTNLPMAGSPPAAWIADRSGGIKALEDHILDREIALLDERIKRFDRTLAELNARMTEKPSGDT